MQVNGRKTPPPWLIRCSKDLSPIADELIAAPVLCWCCHSRKVAEYVLFTFLATIGYPAACALPDSFCSSIVNLWISLAILPLIFSPLLSRNWTTWTLLTSTDWVWKLMSSTSLFSPLKFICCRITYASVRTSLVSACSSRAEDLCFQLHFLIVARDRHWRDLLHIFDELRHGLLVFEVK